MDGPTAMDIDPIDDGPSEMPKGIIPMTRSGAITTTSSGFATTSAPGPMHEITKEEEARQAIDMLRGEDVSQRVAAASRLESIASVLGEKRTREVRKTKNISECVLAIARACDQHGPVLLPIWSCKKWHRSRHHLTLFLFCNLCRN